MIRTVLCVDDEADILKLLNDTLTTNKFNVHTALTGSDALQILKTHPVDLITIDVNMPEMDGIHLMKKIKKLCPDTPVIALTSNMEDDVFEKLEHYGCTALVEKACSLDYFVKLIHATIAENIHKHYFEKKSFFDMFKRPEPNTAVRIRKPQPPEE